MPARRWASPVAFTLWNHYLRYDPANPHWPNRDRFVLSVGHASMLLYSLLHLAEVAEKDGANAPAVSLEDIKKFRQLDSRTPGHPEYHFTTGVEVTTGPLGQGVANSVGMAMGGRFLGERLAYGDQPLFDYNVYAMCSDGDLMEGVSAEAASIAGHLRLSNLCWIYDNNTITIEGHTDLAFSEEVAARFLAYGWQVLRVADANDTVAVSHAIETFLQSGDRPTLIIVNSVIGYGAPTKQGTPKAHSDALGPDEVKGAKRAYGWPEDSQFLVPDGVYDNFRQGIGARGKALREEWLALVEEVKAGDAGLAKDLATYLAGGLPEDWDADIPVFPADAKGLATRESSGKVLNAIANRVPWLLGGSADLAPSNKTKLESRRPAPSAVHARRTQHPFRRARARDGLDRQRPRSGGPARLRGDLPGLLRLHAPADPARRPDGAAGLPRLHPRFDRGGRGRADPPAGRAPAGAPRDPRPRHLPPGRRQRGGGGLSGHHAAQAPAGGAGAQPPAAADRRPDEVRPGLGVAKGAYVLAGADEAKPDVILIGTGSEVQLCLGAYETLRSEGVKARVVSMPSWDLFEQQDEAYRNSVLPPEVTARVAVEQGSVIGWDRYTGSTGTILGMHTFGSSAPIKDLQSKFGFTPEKVLEAARAQVAKSKG